MNEIIQKSVAESVEIQKTFFEAKNRLIEHVASLIVKTFDEGNKVILFGNGGSAADAQHMAAEFVGRFGIDRDPLPAIALTTDASILTAIANDFGFEQVFSRQVQAPGYVGDVAIGISTSGHSETVIEAIVEAKKKGLITVGFTGCGGGELGKRVDYDFSVPSNNVAQIGRASCRERV